MAKIKICGLKTIEDIRMANRLKPDYIGFVFAGKKRKITPAQALEMKRCLCPGIQSVGVFVNEDIRTVAQLADQGITDLIQLHGEEDASYIRDLRNLTDKAIIKAVRVTCPEDILKVQEVSAEYLLLDSYHAGEYGGSGVTFNWEMIPELTKPYFLAGGLNTGNVCEALKRCSPFAVDVSSSVETDGRKDEKKIEEFINRVRKREDKRHE